MTSVYLHNIQTGVPPTRYCQQDARDRVKEQFDDRRARRIVHRLYNQSGIERRFTAVETFGSDVPGTLFCRGADGKFTIPGTRERNTRFAEAARELSVSVARRVLDGAAGFDRRDITHLITVTCTGFSNPGPDYHIIREVGLASTTQRYQIGFMGCYAAFPALRMARQFCLADPRAAVLVVCVELCSLHVQFEPDNVDALLAGSLFADGAAAAIVSARPLAEDRPGYLLHDLHSDLIPSGEQAMTWDIGDRGFDIKLSTYVPDILGANLQAVIGPILACLGVGRDDIGAWAVHPGGRAILDRVRDGLGLDESQLAASRRILRDYGNMSSPTILFVLDDLLSSAPPPRADLTAAMAFGPGLTVEFALLQPIRSGDAPKERRQAADTGRHAVGRA